MMPTVSNQPIIPASQKPRQAFGLSTATDGDLQLPPLQGQLLQERYPQQEAHLIQPKPFSLVGHNAGQAADTLVKISKHQPVKDGDLANLDDHMKRGGSLLIATLATLGLKQRILGVGEFLGFLSWFGAMAATPRVINGMVQAKTGINLNQMYASSYGQNQNLYKDPSYLPLQILSDEEINRAADKLGIPVDAPNRRKLTEEKFRQISVQSHTWWMLVAGPATPVISGLVCDVLQDPVVRLIHQIKLKSATLSASIGRKPGEGDVKAQQKLAKKVEKALNQLVGEVPESALSTWWKTSGRKMPKLMGLQKKPFAEGLKKALNYTREEQAERLIKAFSEGAGDAASFDKAEGYVKKQQAQLEKMRKKAIALLDKYDSNLPEAEALRMYDFVNLRFDNALNTLSHYDKLLKGIKKGVGAEQIRNLLEKPVLPEAQRLLDTGSLKAGEEMIGNSNVIRQVRLGLAEQKYNRAFVLMGASPSTHLQQGLRNNLLRKLWRRRIGGLGTGLLAATALYNWLFVGRDFSSKPVHKPDPASTLINPDAPKNDPEPEPKAGGPA